MPAAAPSRRKPGLWFILAGVSFAFGFVYFLVPAESLPVFIPGHAAGDHTHLIANAVLCALGAVVLFIAGAASLAALDRERREREDRLGPRTGTIRTIPTDPPR